MSIASELTNLSTNISNAYDAVSAKGGTIPANKNTVNLATAISSISGGGGTIQVTNGRLEQIKGLSSTVAANMFVDVLNTTTAGTYRNLTSTSNTYYSIGAAAISSNKVFAMFRAYNSPTIYGVVCTLSNTSITVGTATEIATDANTTSLYASAVKLDTDKVFVIYGSSTSPMGVVCTISGTTITAGQSATIATATNGYEYVKAATLSSNKVLTTYRNGNFLYGSVCEISGTTITPGTSTQLASATLTYTSNSPTPLSSDKVFIAYRSSNYAYGQVCTISGTTITTGTETQLSTYNSSFNGISTTTLASDKVFVTHAGTGNHLNGQVCTISGTTVTPGTAVELSPLANSYVYASAVALSPTKVFVAHQGGPSSSSSYLYGTTAFVNGTSIFVGSDIQIDNSNYASNGASPTAVDSDRVFIAHRKGSYAAAHACNASDLGVMAATSRIKGLTSTECTTSAAGDVWVLNA